MAEEICNVEDAEDMGTKRRKLEVPESEGLQQAHAHLSLSQHSLRKKDGEESETRSKSKREGEEERKEATKERLRKHRDNRKRVQDDSVDTREKH